MKIKKLILNNFGPFEHYEVEFPTDEKACILITGKNNAGKTSLLRALGLIDNAMKLANGKYSPINRDLRKKDVQDINIKRLIHGFGDGTATVTAILDTYREIEVIINSSKEIIQCTIPANTPRSIHDLLGFIPSLGQLSEEEPYLTKNHVLNYLNTTMAPRHLRNHIYHLLDRTQKDLLIRIIYDSWNKVVLGNVEHDIGSDQLYCPYSEGSSTGEISLSGQGFQIWLQLMTHLIRLSHVSSIVLDEPEIFLHPEKQHKLIHMFREYFDGSLIIATHSPELMNEVDFSHIIYIQKEADSSRVYSTVNREALEDIRSKIGSSFNLVASQFEDVEKLIATENVQDYEIINRLAIENKLNVRTHNIPIFGLSRWADCIQYKNAYKIFFGKEVTITLLLDKDYYPEDYRNTISRELGKNGIKTIFTPGKEIENIFLDEAFLLLIMPSSIHKELIEFLDRIYDDSHEKSLVKYAEFHKKYSEGNKRKEYSTVYDELKPSFNAWWSNKKIRHNLIPGKHTLAKLRQFIREKTNTNLTTADLLQRLVETRNSPVLDLISEVFNIK